MKTTVTAGALTLAHDEGLLTVSLNGKTLPGSPCPVFRVWLEGVGNFVSDGMACEAKVDTSENFSLLNITYTSGALWARVGFLSENNEIRVSVTLKAAWRDGIPGRATLELPWLAALCPSGAAERFPAKTAAKPSGATCLQMKKLCPPPYCAETAAGEGIAAYFPLDAANLSWDPCRNIDLCDIASRKELEACRMSVRLSESPTMAADVRLWPLSDGWRECFTRFRREIRARVPQTQYEREDLQWMRDVRLTHFSYAFGREFFDYSTGRPNLDALLDAGEAFGGYDAILLWHEYPRLGLDARTQWDFYDDYPGGRAALRALVDRAHQRNVRVFLPFKPWDRSPVENDAQTTARIAALIAELDLDGVFFDTMNTVPESFRAAIDAAKPGVVFITESEPHEYRALEMITSSWNQYRTEISMPESNLMRFLFPKHTRGGISRWHVGAQKDIAIERALFNGEGMIIWQDVFGAWLPYSQAQKREICAVKRLLAEHADLLNTQDCVPLLTTAAPGVYANGFFDGDRAAVTLYLTGDAPYEGDLLARLPYQTARECRDALPMTMRGGVLHGRLTPGRTALVLLERS